MKQPPPARVWIVFGDDGAAIATSAEQANGIVAAGDRDDGKLTAIGPYIYSPPKAATRTT